MDGGVRQNTPIAPALRLGATHVFTVGISREIRGVGAGDPPTTPPGAALVLGKVMNAFLLDHVQNDINVLGRINHMIEDGERAYGPGFLEKMNAAAIQRGALPYRRVESLIVTPSADIGRLAAIHLRSGKLQGAALLQRQLMAMLDVGDTTESDLASYLLFDGGFARQLIELGRADAEARRQDITAFFGSAADDLVPEPAVSRRWSVPPPVE
jgi:NTE family protein